MDAWKQKDELISRFTQRYKVRKDLEVVAAAYDRHVKLIIKEYDYTDPLPMPRLHITERNVITMRQLAQALNDACDFVLDTNPIWADNMPEIETIVPKEASDG